ENLKWIRENINNSQRELKRLTQAKEEIAAKLNEKKRQRDELVGMITEIKEMVGANAAKLAELEDQIEQLEREQGHLEVKIKAEEESNEILVEQIQTLEARKKNFEELHNSFVERLKGITQIRRKEQSRLEDIIQTIEKVKRQREVSDTEIKNAEKVIKQGRLSVTEFTSRKELAETILSEEKALEHIESLAKLGALTGVHGRLEERIRFENKYRKAVEAAAEGWLRALIVEDVSVVWKCAESLKRAKIGRVKLLPLENLKGTKLTEKPSIEGVTCSVASLIDCAAKYKPAVNFVFGDTFVASSEETALQASDQGYRVVTIDGQVFKPGFRLEVGFYREPIDLSEVIPSDIAIKRISETVTSLEQLLNKRVADLKRLGDELIRLEGEKTAQMDTIKALDQQVEELELNTARIHKDLAELNRRLKSFNHRYEVLQNSISSSKAKVEELEKQLHILRVEAANLRKKLKPETVTKMEGERATLESEISDLERRYNEILSKMETLDSNLKSIFIPSITTARNEIVGIRKNINAHKRRIEMTTKQLEEATSRLKELESSKEKLSTVLLAKKEEAKRFNEAIEEINKQLRTAAKELEQRNDAVNSLKQEMIRHQMEIEQAERELKLTGFDLSIEIKADDLAILESSIERLREEFENLADKINMTAVESYEPQKKNYKELSVRINQLEEEKRAILRFMESIEREKRDTFLSALEKVNQKFSESFHLITGGKGWLQLQNPENPFEEGLDILVEFPGKAPILVTGASGGEKSVVAVCYIFALQTLTKTSPFYIFDEIDAHLDPVNTQRLADLLAKEAQTSQIIAITFKEPMATKANKVIGIHGRNGVSYVYSMPKVA
ncbi:MAG: chromosome segregation SMC family protein, partial [Candidatus Bathyarchaeia archaeon]